MLRNVRLFFKLLWLIFLYLGERWRREMWMKDEKWDRGVEGEKRGRKRKDIRRKERLCGSWNWFLRERRREAGNCCSIPSSLIWHTHTPVRTHLHIHTLLTVHMTHTHTLIPQPLRLFPFNLAQPCAQISRDHPLQMFVVCFFPLISVAKLALCYTSKGNTEQE